MKKSLIHSLVISLLIFLGLLPIFLQLLAYLHPVVLAVVWVCLFLVTLFVVFFVYKEILLIPKLVLDIFMCTYSVGLIILLFFRPNEQSYETVNLIPFETISFFLSGQVDFLVALYNLAANIGLFLPFGVYYGLVSGGKGTFGKLLLIAVCAVSVIEGLQFFTNRGSLDIDDLLLNVLGVSLGFFIYPFVRKVIVLK